MTWKQVYAWPDVTLREFGAWRKDEGKNEEFLVA